MANKDIVAIVLAEQVKELKDLLNAKNEEIEMLKLLVKNSKKDRVPLEAHIACAPKAAAIPAKKAVKTKSAVETKKSTKKVKSDGSPDMRTTEGKALAAAMQLAAVSSSDDDQSQGEGAEAMVAAWALAAPVETAAEPVAEHVAQPVAEHVAQPATEHVAEPAAEAEPVELAVTQAVANEDIDM